MGHFERFYAYYSRVEKKLENPLVKDAIWFYIVRIQFAKVLQKAASGLAR